MPRFFLGSTFTAIRERVIDTFSRNNSASLDTATDGSLWQTIRAGLGVDNLRATATNPEQYPISTVDMPSNNVDIALSGVSQGAGAAIWVQSSDDWYSVTIDQTARVIPEVTNVVSTNYSYSSRFADTSTTQNSPYWVATFNNAYNSPGSWTVTTTNNATGTANATANYKFTAWNTYYFKYSSVSFYKYYYFGTISGSAWAAKTTWGWASSGNSYTANASYTYKVSYTYQVTTSSTYSYTIRYPATFAGNAFGGYNTSTVAVPGYQYTAFAPYNYSVTVPESTVYDQKVNIRQSIAGNISLLQAFLVSSSEVIRSLLVKTSNDVVTVKPYTDANLVSQIGPDLVYTATGAEITPKFGLTISPSSYAQGTTAAANIDIKA